MTEMVLRVLRPPTALSIFRVSVCPEAGFISDVTPQDWLVLDTAILTSFNLLGATLELQRLS
jgi:hypothetical protein